MGKSQNIMRLIACKILIFVFIFLLTIKLNRDSHINASIFFIFVEMVLEQTSSSFNTKLKPPWKDRKSSYKLEQILGLFLPLDCSKINLKQCERP